MRLTEFTDHALRLLLYLGQHRDRIVTVDEIARRYGISRNHLAKVVNELGACGLIDTLRGRSGGMRLARDPRQLRMGEVVRRTEPNFHMVKCFAGEARECPFDADCRLRASLARATAAYLHELDRVTLADLLSPCQDTTLAPI